MKDRSRPDMPGLLQPAWWHHPAALLMALALVLAVPMLVLSSHQFTDVPTAHVFHDQISNLVTAGVTTGCTGTTYCPDTAVTRAQMAAFLGRVGSRVGLSTTLLDAAIAPADGFVTVASKAITVPGTTGGTQFVEVTAYATVFNNAGSAQGCPCNINAKVIDLTSLATSPTAFYQLKPVTNPALGTYDQLVVGHSFVFAVPSGVTRTFGLQIAVFQATSALNVASPSVVVKTYPFGSAGGPALQPEVARPQAPAAPTQEGTPPR